MYEYENDLYRKGFVSVCGVDEAGRGPLAGPVVAGAVILNPNHIIEGLNDSKKLTPKKREILAEAIKKYALAYGVGYVFETEIDQINIYEASRKAMVKAIETLKIDPDFILTDAMPLFTSPIPYLALIKGDQISASIAAASILAKVSRDEYMVAMDNKYPNYGFAIHKGYPTKNHLLALKQYGPCPIHRKTYRPVRVLLEQQQQLVL
ncbi:MAG: ribonuclease HII [Candidatus Izemoplasmatales bacterium]|jgi:ribonuclease HII|nr:ribonuclease HII [Candidatus Izemoplasmatales bacterium]MDD3865702.1 ribonuclease HII [Candidatus Izemoplasmatales bacterium]